MWSWKRCQDQLPSWYPAAWIAISSLAQYVKGGGSGQQGWAGCSIHTQSLFRYHTWFSCTVHGRRSHESALLLFQFYFNVSDEQRLIVTVHYKSLLGNKQVLAEAYVRCHSVCIFINMFWRVFIPSPYISQQPCICRMNSWSQRLILLTHDVTLFCFWRYEGRR